MATDNEVNANEQKIVNEFCHHLEKHYTNKQQ